MNRIDNILPNLNIYSSNVYFIRGAYNAIADVNSLIDAGNNPQILDEINKLYTGVGKKTLDQIIITHAHFDHTGLIPELVKLYQPKIMAWNKFENYNTINLKDNDIFRLGDEWCQIIHTPGHSNDSICIYCPESKCLFSGDTQLNVQTTDGTYTREYIRSLEKLTKLNINIIYPGHGNPITDGNNIIRNSLEYVKMAKCIDCE